MTSCQWPGCNCKIFRRNFLPGTRRQDRSWPYGHTRSQSAPDVERQKLIVKMARGIQVVQPSLSPIEGVSERLGADNSGPIFPYGSRKKNGPAKGRSLLLLVEVAITCSDFALPPRNPRRRCARTADRSTFGLARSVLQHPPIGRMPPSNSRLGDWCRFTQSAKGRSRGPLQCLVEVARIELASGSAPQSGLHA